MNTTERELPMLAGIARIFHWFEELLNILNGPILMFGAGIALVDLLTDGALTASAPFFLIAWALSQALGIDTQLLGCFARARSAVDGWRRAGWLFLGAVLGYAAWQAGYVYAIQQSEHISESAALSRLGMSPALWLGWRAFLAVGLVALSGWTRYVAPQAATLEDERTRLQRELDLAPMRAEVRRRKAAGWRTVAATAFTKTEAPAEARPPEPPHPTGGLPVERPVEQETEAPAESFRKRAPIRMISGHAATVQAARRNDSQNRSRLEQLRGPAFKALDENPGMSWNDLRKMFRCQTQTANTLLRQWRLERRQQTARRA